MRLARTHFAYDEITSFLAEGPGSALIESYLVQYLLVAFYSELEERVKGVISARIGQISDARVAHFINRMNDSMLKRVKKNDLNDVLQKFGCGEGDIISGLVGDLNLQPYHDIITNRHLVSHQAGTNMTLPRIAAALPIAETMLDALESALAAADEAEDELLGDVGAQADKPALMGIIADFFKRMRR